MLQTIEVKIDAKGHIHLQEALPLPYARRALLTILPAAVTPQAPLLEKQEIESAFGLLTASKTVSLEEMKSAVRKRGGTL